MTALKLFDSSEWAEIPPKHQMFGLLEIKNRKLTSSEIFLPLCFNPTARTRNPISANCQTDIYFRGKKAILKDKINRFTKYILITCTHVYRKT